MKSTWFLWLVILIKMILKIRFQFKYLIKMGKKKQKGLVKRWSRFSQIDYIDLTLSQINYIF